jgi:hypothetical protein
MPRSWSSDHDRRRQVVYVIDAATPLSVIGHVDGGYVSLLVGENHRLVLRMSPTGALRVVRLLQAVAA